MRVTLLANSDVRYKLIILWLDSYELQFLLRYFLINANWSLGDTHGESIVAMYKEKKDNLNEFVVIFVLVIYLFVTRI